MDSCWRSYQRAVTELLALRGPPGHCRSRMESWWPDAGAGRGLADMSREPRNGTWGTRGPAARLCWSRGAAESGDRTGPRADGAQA